MRATGRKAADEVKNCEQSAGVGRAEAFGELAGDGKSEGNGKSS